MVEVSNYFRILLYFELRKSSLIISKTNKTVSPSPSVRSTFFLVSREFQRLQSRFGTGRDLDANLLLDLVIVIKYPPTLLIRYPPTLCGSSSHWTAVQSLPCCRRDQAPCSPPGPPRTARRGQRSSARRTPWSSPSSPTSTR